MYRIKLQIFLLLYQAEFYQRERIRAPLSPSNSSHSDQNALQKTESKSCSKMIDNIWIFLLSLVSY